MVSTPLVLLLASLAGMAFMTDDLPRAEGRLLEPSAAAACIGGSLMLPDGEGGDGDGGGEWDHWAYCKVEPGCNRSAEENNGLGCAESYGPIGSAHLPNAECWTQICVYSCENDFDSGTCLFAWTTDCKITTMLNGKNCGKGSLGVCWYNEVFTLGRGTDCYLIAQCHSNGEVLESCGVNHVCETVE